MAVKQRAFEDPAALPLLREVARELESRGYNVTEPKPGKACHGYCIVTFAEVEIDVVLLVQRQNGSIQFDVLTWPSQSLRQRMRSGTRTKADCPEWAELCLAFYTIVLADSRVESVRMRTFDQAQAEQ